MAIQVVNQIAPVFTQIAPICQNTTPPLLPGTSNNGISGIWGGTINTSTVGTTTYSFSPFGGQCASSATMDIVITPPPATTFAPIGPLCQNSTAPALPTSSTNGVTGTWSPATINTATVGTATYTFTPAAGQCGTTVTMDVVILNGVTPAFTQIGPLCQNSTAPVLPTTSTNGVTGTWSPATINTATAGTTTYTFTPSAGQCGPETKMDIAITPQVTTAFTQLGPLCQNSTAPALPASSNNGVPGTWSPATINTSTVGSTTYTFTPAAGECATTATMNVVITANSTPTFTQIGPLCQNSTPPVLPTTSTNNITGTWNPATINTSAASSTTYTFTPAAGECGGPATMTIVTTSQSAPTFAAIGPLCQNSTAPSLPTTSSNGVSGTWSPATINTSAAGTTTYTFTPAATQCGTSVTMSIVVTSQVVPTFNPMGSLCQNSVAPTLPTTSTNGMTGSWSPAIINTSTIGTTPYTFTPVAGQCGATATMNVVITSQLLPTFTQIPPLCSNTTAPVLPATSNNGITGTWSPATINTSSVGTTTHTFTPAPGQCGTTATMTIVVTSQVGPTFNAIGPLCQNAAPPALPTTSTNGITGTWSPATINTSTVGTTTYTFTQTAGQCARTATMNITVNAPVKPTFNAMSALCQNSTAPTLPVTSTNGITGTWSPATINTTVVGATNYTFTPTPGQCAETVSLTITVTSQVTPTLAQIGPLCQNSAPPPLPTTSTNGIRGTWSPATINTASIGSTSYTFTPNGGQCGRIVTMIVTIVPVVKPIFDPIDQLCQHSTPPQLPAKSTNGITGTWNPATINTANTGTSVYTFNPAAGQCATPTNLSITINPDIPLSFAPIGPFCQGFAAPALPTKSIEGIAGTWSPSTINTALIGTTTYTFTPSAGQCGATTTIEVEITSQIVPTFTPIGNLCQNSNPPALPKVSSDGFSGTWSPDTISTTKIGTTTYTFTPDAGQCGTTATVNVVITNQVTPIFNAIGPLCQNSPAVTLPTTSTNGIIGTWNPATINTSTLGTTNYVFTPTANQCGTKTTMDVFIVTGLEPTFTQIGPLCQGSTASQLPKTSDNGISGTWSPAKINTDTAGKTTYTFTPANTGQCAIPATMDITVKPVLKSSTTITICTNQLPYSWNGQSFFASGTYNVTLLSSQACDSLATLNLVVNSFLTSTTNVSTCPAQLPYLWNGRSYNAAGTYTTTLQNSKGCDSVATLILTVTPTIKSVTEVSVCSSELPYSWSGQKYPLAGTYSKTLKTQTGCDSIATLILTVNPLATAAFSGIPTICPGVPTSLNLNLTGAGPWKVVYSDGTSSHTIDSITVSPYQLSVSPAVTTTYTVTSVSNKTCINPNLKNSFTLAVIPSPKGIRYTTEFVLPKNSKQLHARNLGSGYSYNWNPPVGLNLYSIPNPVFNYDKTTEYTISLTSTRGCLTVDTLLVKVVTEYSGDLPAELFVPKAWTPNGDGKNDVLFPYPAKIKELRYFRVFNRWGQLMFETNQLLKGWNGIYNGKPQVMDSYFWIAEAIGIDGTIIKRSGNAALLR